jgi:hypothetical protein
MKIKLLCFECPRDYESKNGEFLLDLEVQDSGLYDVTCPQGHRSLVCLKNQKYEVLFEFGAMALVDGYTREAVASMAASLERFFEFYVKVIFCKYDVPYVEFKKGWKKVAAQSERQLGAFMFLYLLENQKAAELIEDKYTTFRNNVIHKGYIPSYEEVVEYGERILKFITEVHNELKATSADYVKIMKDEYVMEILMDEKVKIDKTSVPVKVGFDKANMPLITQHMTTIINLAGINISTQEKEPVSFKTSLDRLRHTGIIWFQKP